MKKSTFEFVHKTYENIFANAYLVHFLSADMLAPLAVRLLKPEWLEYETVVQRFQDATKSLQRLNHPNIIAAHTGISILDRPGLVSEYIPGVPLSSVLSSCKEQNRGFPVECLVTVMKSVADAMRYAHEKMGLVHLSLSPENFLLQKNGHLSVVHFESSHSPYHQAKTDNELIGTLKYFAPEHVLYGFRKPSVDVYALGLVLFEMFTLQELDEFSFNRSQFQSKRQKYQHHWNTQLKKTSLPEDCAKTLSDLFARMLSFIPESRPCWNEIYTQSERILSQLPNQPTADFLQKLDISPVFLPVEKELAVFSVEDPATPYN